MLIVSLLYWAFLILACPILFIPALLIWIVTVLFDRRRVILHLYSSLWAAILLWANPIWRVRVSGRKKIPWRSSAVLVSNHLSLIDIMVLFLLWRPFKWVSKSENFSLPFIGWNMRLNAYVPLVRGDRASVQAMMEMCRKYLGNRTSVLIFPEGTRSATGELTPFKDGAFTLAKETGRPVIPIVITGTHDTLPKHSLILRNRMDAQVRILDPLDPGDFASAEELRDATHRRMEAALGGPGALSEAV